MESLRTLSAKTLLSLLFCLNFFTLSAQDKPEVQSVFDFLTAEEGAKLTLEMDFTTLLENRKTSQYFPAGLTTQSGQSFKIEVRPRGKYRRKVCEIPPLKLKFSNKSLKAQGFDTLNEIKLVMPCFDNNEGDDLIIREYLAYKMYEQLSYACVRARLIRLTLHDTHVEKSKRTMYCILVEDEEETAKRLNGKIVEEYGIPPDSLLMQQAALVSIFEYMIGNTDWETAMLRNVRLVQSNTGGKIIVMPYDFDFSGFVGAPYASPSSDSGLKNVRDRFLMANGIKRESLRRAVQLIKKSRKDLIDICKNKHISKESSVELITYLETFFTLVEENDDVPTTLRIPTD